MGVLIYSKYMWINSWAQWNHIDAKRSTTCRIPNPLIVISMFKNATNCTYRHIRDARVYNFSHIRNRNAFPQATWAGSQNTKENKTTSHSTIFNEIFSNAIKFTRFEWKRERERERKRKSKSITKNWAQKVENGFLPAPDSGKNRMIQQSVDGFASAKHDYRLHWFDYFRI